MIPGRKSTPAEELRALINFLNLENSPGVTTPKPHIHSHFSHIPEHFSHKHGILNNARASLNYVGGRIPKIFHTLAYVLADFA